MHHLTMDGDQVSEQQPNRSQTCRIPRHLDAGFIDPLQSRLRYPIKHSRAQGHVPSPRPRPIRQVNRYTLRRIPGQTPHLTSVRIEQICDGRTDPGPGAYLPTSQPYTVSMRTLSASANSLALKPMSLRVATTSAGAILAPLTAKTPTGERSVHDEKSRLKKIMVGPDR